LWAISRLLDMGALTTSYLTLTPEIIESHAEKPAHSILRYNITPFGKAIMEYVAEKMGMFSPDMISKLENIFGEGEKKKSDKH